VKAAAPSVAVAHGFLEGSPPIFASYHPPTSPARDIAYVVCQPLHYDLIQCYRSMRRCAEELADSGFHVMRVHYDGTNESVHSTDYDPDRVEAWLESVRRAVAAMQAIPGVKGVGIVGVRIGAAFAMETATRLDVARLVLWEPSVGATYAREMEILASSTPQMLKSGGASDVAADGGLVAGGYWLSKQTLADLARLDIEKMALRGKPDVLIVHRDDRRPSPRLQQHLERLGCAVTAVQLPGHKQMMMLPDKSTVPAAILAKIRDWAVERSGVTDEAPRGDAVELAGEAVIDGLLWRPVRFGSTGHLFGVLTEPVSGPKAGLPGVLLMTGGVVPRTSGNGSYVTLARRLASKGHAVLRMDVAYIGESGTADGSHGDPNTAFPPTIVDDARAGLALLSQRVARGEVWMLGLCSGAYASFQTMLAEPRVRGAFLLNPVAFYPKDVASADARAGEGAPAPAMSTVDQMQQMQRYLQVMKDPESWKKLLSGKADVKNVVNVVRGRVASKLGAAKERIAVRLGRAPQGLAGDVDRLLARGGRVCFVFAEGDPGHPALLAELGARLDGLLGKGMVLEVFAGADHNFHEVTTRAKLLDFVEATIQAAR
jgi:dienelactone hydrolase